MARLSCLRFYLHSALERDVVTQIVERGLRLVLRGGRGVIGRLVVAATATAGRRTHTLARTEHLHVVAANFGGVALLAILIGPLAGAQAAFDIDLRALLQILAANLGQLAESRDTDPLGHFLAFAGLLVLPVLRAGNAEIADCLAAGGVACFRIAPQIADADPFVYRCHCLYLLNARRQYFLSVDIKTCY